MPLWGHRRCRRRATRRRCGLVGDEVLESRVVLTPVSLTDHEQLMLEFINRARANPAAEASRYGIALNAGLPAGTISTEPKQPLAPHQSLINASRLHSQDMLDQDYFSHTSLSGTSPAGRATTAGYPSSNVGENIAWGGTTGSLDQGAEVPARHESLFRSAGHRQNMLHIPYEEVGIGLRFGVFRSSGTNYNASMVTENFGIRNVNPLITGVVYTDSDNNDFYSIGEAIRAGTITARNTSTGTEYSETIGVSGGYGIIVPSGAYTVTARYQTGGIQRIAVDSVVVASANVKLDFETGSVTTIGLALTRDVAEIEEVGAVTTSLFTLTRTGDSGSAVTFSLTTSDASETSLPASVTIPAGQVSATFTVSAMNDGIIDGSQVSTITAAAASYPSASALVTTVDTTRPLLPVGPHAVGSGRPVITWTAVSNAASYQVWVNNVSTGASEVINQAGLTATSFTPAADLPLATYRVWVRGVTSAGLTSRWSVPQDWRVTTPPVVAGSGAVHNTSGFLLLWSEVPGAASYDVWIDSLSTGTSQYVRNSAVVGTSLALSNFPIGQYAIWVRARGSSGEYGSWSARAVQTVDLSPASLTISSGLFSSVPVLSWQAVPGAALYDVWVDNLSTAASMVLRNTSVAGTSLEMPELGSGSYRAWVRARDAAGTNYRWSTTFAFEHQRASRLTAPTGLSATPTPEFTWTAVAGATRFELWVDSRDGLGRVIYFSSLTSSSYQPTTLLAAGNYRVWVRAFDSSGAHTGWSSFRDFSIAMNQVPVHPGSLDAEVREIRETRKIREDALADQLFADVRLLDAVLANHRVTAVPDTRELAPRELSPPADTSQIAWQRESRLTEPDHPGHVDTGPDDTGPGKPGRGEPGSDRKGPGESVMTGQAEFRENAVRNSRIEKKGRSTENRTAPGGLAVELLRQPEVTPL